MPRCDVRKIGEHPNRCTDSTLLQRHPPQLLSSAFGRCIQTYDDEAVLLTLPPWRNGPSHSQPTHQSCSTCLKLETIASHQWSQPPKNLVHSKNYGKAIIYYHAIPIKSSVSSHLPSCTILKRVAGIRRPPFLVDPCL